MLRDALSSTRIKGEKYNKSSLDKHWPELITMVLLTWSSAQQQTLFPFLPLLFKMGNLAPAFGSFVFYIFFLWRTRDQDSKTGFSPWRVRAQAARQQRRRLRFSRLCSTVPLSFHCSGHVLYPCLSPDEADSGELLLPGTKWLLQHSAFNRTNSMETWTSLRI